MNWTPDQIDYIRANYGNIPLYLLAWKVRRGEDAVRQKYRQLMKNRTDDKVK